MNKLKYFLLFLCSCVPYNPATGFLNPNYFMSYQPYPDKSTKAEFIVTPGGFIKTKQSTGVVVCNSVWFQDDKLCITQDEYNKMVEDAKK